MYNREKDKNVSLLSMKGLMRVLEYIVAEKPPQNELILVLNELGYVLCSFAMAWVLHTVIGSAGID
jgi:hypothetical protein